MMFLLALRCFLFVFFLHSFLSAEARLAANYYNHSCPQLEDIIRDVVMQKQITTPTTAGGVLRLFFHDCFADGCDASILISSTSFNKAERDAEDNLSLPGDGFDAITRAKAQLELACPGVVSCADILAVATRDLISMAGGPYYKVRLGRKDSVVSNASLVTGNLPGQNMNVTHLASMFASKGFTIEEMVALVGAHTIGFSHCNKFADRIYNFSSTSSFDPSMNTRYAEALQKSCAHYKNDSTLSAFNDIMTPGKFDNRYYQNLANGLGLLASDQAFYVDNRTRVFVDLYAKNETAFFAAFTHAMKKLSVHGVKVGKRGEVRRRCDEFNG